MSCLIKAQMMHRFPTFTLKSKYLLSKAEGLLSLNQVRLFNRCRVLYADSKSVKVPPLPESITEADVRWLKAVGDKVKVDEVIGELETDKTTLPINSPYDGVLNKINFEDGSKIVSTDILCEITADESDSQPTSNMTESKKSENISGNATMYIKTPAFPESITEGDMRWHKSVGAQVKTDEIIGEIETDKTSIEVRSPCSGIIESFLVNDGNKVMVDSQIASIKITNENEAEEIKIAEKEDMKAPVEHNNVQPTQSVSKVVDTPKPPPVNIPSMSEQQTFGSDRTVTKVKMTRIRQTIAQRLKNAQNTCAMLTTFNEVDMSNIMEMRKTYQDSFIKKHGIKVGFMSAFAAASAYALKAIPAVNATIENDHIVYYNYVDISVAVASPKGLVVPVLRDVHKMTFADIEKCILDFGAKAKSGKISAEDMEGGTFTISNGGVFGSLMGTPIINPPQSAILGIHAINDRPVAVNGQVVIRPMMYIALTYDHRLIDGREAVTFLKKIKDVIEDPRIMLLDL